MITSFRLAIAFLMDGKAGGSIAIAKIDLGLPRFKVLTQSTTFSKQAFSKSGMVSFWRLLCKFRNIVHEFVVNTAAALS